MINNKQIIAYFPNWGTYNVNHQSLTVGMIPWEKVTMVYHAFFEIGPDWQLKSTDDWADYQKPFEHSEPGWDSNVLKGHIGEYKYYKGIYPNKKLLLSIGGYTKSYNFPQMAVDPQKRKTFIDSCIAFLKKYPFFDGLDIDWEYPQAQDKLNFTIFLKEVKQAYINNSMTDKLLTIAAPLGYQNIQNQDVSNYIQYVDLVNIMAYDVYGAWDNLTNHHSPLYNNPANPESNGPKFNIDAAVKLFMDAGVPVTKLCIGTPYYSRGWKNVDFTSAKGPNGLFANASGAPVGTWDEAYAPGGQWPWYQVKAFETNSEWEKYYDSIAKAPYLINRSKKYFLTYEDEDSLRAKCDYILAKNLAGIIIWEISGDNLTNKAAPMTKILWDRLIEAQGGEVPTIPPNKPSVSVDKQVNLDGVYNVKFTIGVQNTGTNFEIYENGVKVRMGVVTPNSPIQQEVFYQVSGKTPGSYVYKMVLSNLMASVESDTIIITVQTIQPPTTIPSPPIILLDEPNNTGTYNLNILLPPNNNATGLKIYENSILLKTETVTTSTVQQTYIAKFDNKSTGTYVYKAELFNSNGASASQLVTVNVKNPQQPGNTSLPSVPIVSHNNWQNNPNYTISSDMWWGVNATSISLYENNSLISTKTLIDNSPSAQHAEWNITGKPNGSYSYYVKADNINGSVMSDVITVNVTKGIGGTSPKPIAAIVTVDSTPNNGRYTITGQFPESSSANQYTLIENSKEVITGLLTPNKDKKDIIDIKAYTNKTSGTYVYKINVTNGVDTVSSDSLSVTVNASSTPTPTPQPSGNITMSFIIVSDWGTGANFSITMNNNTNTSIDRWTLEFDFDKTIGYTWDSTFTVAGGHYTFTNPSWGGPLPANGSFSFGGGCEGNVGSLKPRNIRLNGVVVQLS